MAKKWISLEYNIITSKWLTMKRQLNQTTEWPKEPLKGEKLLFSFIPHFIIFILLIMPLLLRKLWSNKNPFEKFIYFLTIELWERI